jgi:aminomethyltransferase
MSIKSPLHNIHLELKAKFTEFAGFEMPISYSSIKDEHLTVRKSVGIFDVSHMSNVWIRGKDADKLISLTTVENTVKINDKMSQYTAILRDDGTVIDDTIFMHLGEEFMMIPNAGMGDIITNWLNAIASKYNFDAKAENVSRDYVILAVQGPKSRETLQKLTNTNLETVKFFGCQYIDIGGINCIISHTGYTGELGFELQISTKEEADKLYLDILEAGKELKIKPVGIGARDTLRLEKCFILAGNEFEGGRTPLEALMSWTINWDHDFIGKDALIKQKELGDYQRLSSLECIDKGVPRHGCEIKKDGEKIGIVTSGTLSPCLNKGIAMGYLPQKYREVESILDIYIRNNPVRAKVVKPPFVKKDWVQHH